MYCIDEIERKLLPANGGRPIPLLVERDSEMLHLKITLEGQCLVTFRVDENGNLIMDTHECQKTIIVGEVK